MFCVAGYTCYNPPTTDITVNWTSCATGYSETGMVCDGTCAPGLGNNGILPRATCVYDEKSAMSYWALNNGSCQGRRGFHQMNDRAKMNTITQEPQVQFVHA